MCVMRVMYVMSVKLFYICLGLCMCVVYVTFCILVCVLCMVFYVCMCVMRVCRELCRYVMLGMLYVMYMCCVCMYVSCVCHVMLRMHVCSARMMGYVSMYVVDVCRCALCYAVYCMTVCLLRAVCVCMLCMLCNV